MKQIFLSVILLWTFNVSGYEQNADIRLLRKMNVNRSTNLDASFNFITNTTYPIGIAAPLGLFLVGKLKPNETMEHNGIVTGSAVVLTVAISTIMKYSMLTLVCNL